MNARVLFFRSVRLSLLLGGVLLLATPLHAQESEGDGKDLGWSNVANLGVVATSGNSSTFTANVDDRLGYAWQRADLAIRLGGLVSKKTDDRFAVGSPDDFMVVSDDKRDLDTERYFASAQFSRQISDHFYWLVGAGWDKDSGAGIESRTSAFAGVGNLWIDSDKVRFSTDYGLTYTNRVDEIEDPDRPRSYSEARLTWDYKNQIADSTSIDSTMQVWTRLSELADYRFNTINGVTTTLTRLLALRFSLQFIYQARPALEEIDLYEMAGGLVTGTAVVRKNKLDSTLNFSLVFSL